LCKMRPKCGPSYFCQTEFITCTVEQKQQHQNLDNSVLLKNCPKQTVAQRAKIRPIRSPCFPIAPRKTESCKKTATFFFQRGTFLHKWTFLQKCQASGLQLAKRYSNSR
jgi:hypothetical protein